MTINQHLPLFEALSSNELSNIRLIATDMDGTLTKTRKFTSGLLLGLQDLAAAEIKVLIVTGRSAGWVSGLAYYLPVSGAIAENGGLFYFNGSDRPIAITPIEDISAHRRQLAAVFEELRVKFPQIQASDDNRFRITDWTFDLAGLHPEDLQTLSQMCENLGWGFTYSNVQCHIKPQGQDKAMGLLKILGKYFPQYTSQQVVTVGDSPNDESLFDKRYFPLSVGVANVWEYVSQLQHQPTYVTKAEEAEGFCDLASCLLQPKSTTPPD